jgi:hypothetical protein
VTAHQPGTPGHQPGPAAHQPGPAAHQPGTTGHQPGPAAHQPGTTGHQPGTTAHQPGTTYHQPGAGTRADSVPSFEELMAEVMAAAGRFGHRQHVHLTWLAVRRCGLPAAIGLVSEGIQRTARYAGAPQKYHATVSRAWVELVGHHALESGEADLTTFADRHHALESGEDDFTTFASRHPALLDKRLLTRFYRPATLAAPPAKNGWVEPDLAPFPWHDAHGHPTAGPEADEGHRCPAAELEPRAAPVRWSSAR